MSNNVARGAIGATAIGGAAAGTVAVGAARSTGQILALVRRAVQAGDEGWDVDGHFVSSKFVFNFKTMEVFDGDETHPIGDITEHDCGESVVRLFIRGRMSPKRVTVGSNSRSEMIGRAINHMWSGDKLEPDTRRRLPTFATRVHRLKPSTIFRYALRGLFVGGAFTLWTLSDLHIGPHNGGIELLFLGMFIVFALSIAWRKLRAVVAPRWTSVCSDRGHAASREFSSIP